MRVDAMISVPVSFGELLDKISILRLKSERIDDPQKLAHVRSELAVLQRIWSAHPASAIDVAELIADLQAVNLRLWIIEDDIRICERLQDFGPHFIALARSVYRENDERARIKRELNLRLGSTLVEEKSYADY